MKEIISEIIKNLGEYFWQSIMFATVVLLILSKTKYPEIFNLVDSSAGLTKFIVITILLIALSYILFSSIAFIKLKIENYFELKSLKIKNLNALSTILKNQNVYQNECYILRILVQNKINEFSLETIQKLAYIEEQNNNKKNGAKYSNIDSYFFKEAMEKALISLGDLNLITYKNMHFYKINDEIFEEVSKWI